MLTLAGLKQHLVFFVIERETRRVTIAGIHPQPYGAWMEQLARNLTDPVEGCLRTASHLIHDRDPLYTRVFGEILTGGGVQPIRLPPRSPNLNAYADRFVRSIKEDCLSRVVPLGEAHVRQLVHAFVEHYHHERNHQGRDNQLLQALGDGLAACDLFTVEVLTLAGLQRYLVFFVIALPSRRVTIAGIPPQPYGTWMEQMARNVTDPVEGCLRRARYLMHDRDPLSTRVFGEILEGGGVPPIRLPPKSPNLNAYAERFVRSMKEECLSRVVPLGEGHVRLLVGEYVDHSHRERNHL